ncbi:heavy-metal-associated domain-containing protein [Kordia sp. YSTF-M3]|uniref:Heavy-metal-associated domain-containing protein n=1 Tax=Kordia aestuariivivens TaxID=2759037 RepID=A0ABR7QB86_9FLAO|nr:heavy metal-associated domain-containing protein [Kordia aestuariivivens]MBC8755584.1 heavy-metal-associated domain-containing protein [Kordia aestuariivivens]
MKKIFLVCAMAIAIISCKNNTTPETVTVDTQAETVKKEANTKDVAANYNKAEFKIDGMTCAIGCAKRIESKLASMEGVKSAKVDFDQKLAMVEYNEAKVDFDALTSTVAKVPGDYKISDMKNVDAFAKACKADCKMDCCAKKGETKKACKADCKMACCAKKDAKKTACAEDCKKECCTKKV